MIPEIALEDLPEQDAPEPGTVSVLNVGAGDIRQSCARAEGETDAEYAERRKQFGKMVKDLMRQGYAFFVIDEDGNEERAVAFDADTDEYICKPPKRPKSPKQIAAEDERAKEKKAALKAEQGQSSTKGSVSPKKVKDKKKTKKKGKRIPASSTAATAVGPSSGG
jgi:hypothetical protein